MSSPNRPARAAGRRDRVAGLGSLGGLGGLVGAALALLLAGACTTAGPGRVPDPPVAAAAQATAAAAPPRAASAPGEAFVRVPSGLRVEGAPPVPAAVARVARAYSDYESATLLDWHPSQRELLVARRAPGAAVTQLWRLPAPLGAAEALTASRDGTGAAQYEPRQARYLVISRALGGSEAYRLFRQDLPGRAEEALTGPNERSQLHTWLRQRSVAIVGDVPLDRTAAEGRREQVWTRLWLLDPLKPSARQALAQLPGSGWWVPAVSPDDRHAALVRQISATASEVELLDLSDGRRRRLLPRPGEPEAHFRPVDFSRDGRALWLISDRDSEFRELVRLDLASGQLQRHTAHLPWDVDAAALSHDGRFVALRLNVEGRSELRLLEAETGRERKLPPLPAGSVTRVVWHPERLELAFTVSSARAPNQIHTLDLGEGQVRAWMREPRSRVAELSEQQVVRWTSFDGRTITGLLNRPPSRFTGPRPVYLNIHGGPEAQARVGFAGRLNVLMQELGIAVLQPNVRGSSGYGKSFLKLDDGRLREDAVKDIGALLDWIATQPDLDASRVVVAGGSYGGYMSLAVAARYSERIAGAINVVGISNFNTFLRHTESYRRDLRRAEYGDEREPAMREFLESISPLSHAHRITRPLMVVHGRNDPRVPWTEAEQIVQRVRANGTPVWYLLADNEGHGFTRRDNQDYQFHLTVMFLRQVMGLPG